MGRDSNQTILTGSGGMLGRAFDARLKTKGIDAEKPTRDQIDLTDSASIEGLSPDSSTILIHCAGYTNVDAAESEKELATRINGESVGTLARQCAAAGAMLVQFSTDYVFNGTSSTPYPVDSPMDPINAYGASKALGEKLIRESGCRHLIVRTSWLYAPWGKNFVLTMRQLMRERDLIQVVNDQFGRPTSAEHLAAVTMKLIDAGATGTFHVCDGGQCSWFQFAEEIARLVEYGGRIEPCSSDDNPRPAKRPAYSVLDLSETVKLLGRLPEWRESLADVIRRL
jgi:dTDP-4-dehydrorhamnose reductase